MFYAYSCSTGFYIGKAYFRTVGFVFRRHQLVEQSEIVWPADLRMSVSERLPLRTPPPTRHSVQKRIRRTATDVSNGWLSLMDGGSEVNFYLYLNADET